VLTTKIVGLFGIKHPIIMSGMNWLTEAGLVSAVSDAGGLGILGATQFTPEGLREAIREIRRRTDRPFGINQVLMVPRSDENIKIALDERVPVINYSLGKPWFVPQVHEYGGKIAASVASVKHAARAEKAGVDAVIIVGHEAAAHGGDVTSLVLIPLVANRLKIPVIGAGGFFNGKGLAAALVLGADAIAMGTRFVLTKESVIHDNFRRLCLKAGEEDTLYHSAFDGMPGRVLKTRLAEAVMRDRLPLIKWLSSVSELRRRLNLPAYEMIRGGLRMRKAAEGLSLFAQARLAAAAIRAKKAIEDGDDQQGILPIGQCCGGIDDVPTCKELIERIVIEAEETLKAARDKIIYTVPQN
jgi:enoyl-[acyl-carrier protein] reductase II